MFSTRLPLIRAFALASALVLMSSCTSFSVLQPQQEIELLKKTTDPTSEIVNPHVLTKTEVLEGSIIFSANPKNGEPGKLLYMVSPDGTVFSHLNGVYDYPMALDLTGTLLALRCEYQSDFLCILDLNRRIDYQNFPLPALEDWPDPVLKKIELPARCQWDANDERFLESISWTRQQQIVVVCSYANEPLDSEVWFLTLTGEQENWGDRLYDDVVQFEPSPVDDIYLINRGYENLIVDFEGNRLYDLPHGMFPAWSPDGSKIAYFAFTNSPRSGLAVYNLETNEEVWLYKQPEELDATSEEFLCGVCTYQYNGKISWSPDGSYLVFSATYLGNYVTELFIVNIETKELRFLISPLRLFDGPGLPGWSQHDFRQ